MVSSGNYHPWRTFGLIALSGVIWLQVLVVPIPAEEIARHRIDLEQLRSRIEQIERNLDHKQAAELSLVADLQAVEGEEKRLGNRIAQLSRLMDEDKAAMHSLEERAGGLRRKKESAEAGVRTRLRAMYQGYGDEFWQILFSRDSPARKAQDLVYFQRVIRHDRTLVADYRRDLAELQGATDRIRELRQKREQQLSDLENHRTTLEKARKLKRRLIARIRRDRDRLEEERGAMKVREEELLALIKRLETEFAHGYSQKSGAFSGQRGSLPWPARGKIRTGFGTWRHPELGTLYESQGIEIEAGPGQPVKAIGDGRVVFANPLKGYGNIVIIDHGDSYHSLYARADRLTKRVGDLVSAGETVAISGTENDGGIYFEIRHHGKPVDPTVWLTPQ